MSEDVKCPICGSETVERASQKGPNAGQSNAGQSFHVCNRYPECKGKVAISEVEDVDGFLVGQEEKTEPLTPSVEGSKAEKEVEVKSGKKKRRPLIGCLVVIGVFFVIGVIGAIAGLGDSTPSPTKHLMNSLS